MTTSKKIEIAPEDLKPEIVDVYFPVGTIIYKGDYLKLVNGKIELSKRFEYDYRYISAEYKMCESMPCKLKVWDKEINYVFKIQKESNNKKTKDGFVILGAIKEEEKELPDKIDVHCVFSPK